MSVPSAAKLLRQFDSLCHDERMRSLGLLAQKHSHSPEIDRLITELEAGETFESYLAVRLAALSERVLPLRRALASGSALVMQSAAKYLPRVTGDPETLLEAYEQMVPAVRRSLLRRVVRQERREAAEALYRVVLEREGAARAVVLLPVCRPETVRLALKKYEHAPLNWRSLAQRHPDLVLERLTERLEESSLGERSFLWERYRQAVRYLYLEQAEEVARLALEYGPAKGLPAGFDRIIGGLARRVPKLAFELVTSEQFYSTLQREGLPARLVGTIRSLSLEHRQALAVLLAQWPSHLAALLDEHAPSERAELLEHAHGQFDKERAPWSKKLLDVLPHEIRHAEARRILDLEVIRSDRMRSLDLSAYLPFEEARGALEEAARASDADERALALRSLVRCVGLNRRGIAQALRFCQKIENDQDPVRRKVYEALAACPPTVFEDAHAEPLFSLIAHAFSARDTSWETRAHIREFAVRLIQAHAIRPHGELFGVALDLIEQLAKQSRSLWIELEDRLPPGAEEPLVAALDRPLRQSVRREEYSLLFLFARALGRRAWEAELIQLLLEKATRATPDYVASRAIAHWLEPPRTRDERVQRLLQRDRSNIEVRQVFDHVHRRRQDLLDPYLTKKPLLGRFFSGQTVYVVPARSGFFRWLPRQQRAYGELLDEVVTDEGASTWSRTCAVRVRARLYTTRLEDLEQWVASEDVSIAEAALHGASHLDCPARSCSLLSEHLESSRARVAMYSMYRCASYTPAGAVHRLLDDILRRDRLKVTVEKEAVRLLSRFPTADNVDLLFDYVDGRELHRDVKIAAGRAARNLLHHPRAWDLLEQLARADERSVAVSFVGVRPSSFSEDAAKRYLELLFAVARHEDSFVRSRAVRTLGGWAKVEPRAVAAFVAEYITDLESVCWKEALRALIDACRHGDAREYAVETARFLCSLALEDQPEAEAQRDLPARQRLKEMAERFALVGGEWVEQLRPALLGIDEVLSNDPTLLSLRLDLRITATRWRNANSALDDLTALVDELGDGWLGSEKFGWRVASHLKGTLAAKSEQEQVFRPLALELSESSDHRLRRLGVAVLSVVGPQLRWPTQLAETLRRMRRDDHVGVRAAALNLFTAPES